MGLRVTGDQSLPVRPYYVPQSRDFEGLGGQGVSHPGGEERMAQGQAQGGAIPTSINIWIIGPIPPCPTVLRTKRFAMALRRVGGQGINPDHKCKFQLLGLGKAVCPQPASFNVYTPKRSARRRRDAPPYLIFNLPKRTRRALRSVGPSCGERDTPVRPLPVIFFGDDSLEVEW